MNFKGLFIILFAVTLFSGCKEKLPELYDFGGREYNLVDQNYNSISFPGLAKGKLAVVGYLFTNCPDICPLTTNNMRLIQERLKKENVKDVEFVSISFDPLTDTPEVMRKFAQVRNLDLSNWSFLTGQKPIIDDMIKQAEVFAVPNDSAVFKDGRKIYFYVHTDRIQLMDRRGVVRKNYPGSNINAEEIITDIKNLSSE